MILLIRTISFTATGREIVREREVTDEVVGVGRAAENQLHLPDLAVEQRHLTLRELPTGALLAEAAGTLGFTLDGVTTMRAEIDPARGGEIGVGAYRLAVGREDDTRALLTIRKVESDDGEGRDRLRGFNLDSALPSKRIMAWVAIIAVLVAFLAVPIWSNLTRERAEPDIDTPGTVMWDASWSTGDLSSVHHGLEDNCEACHTEPFVAVRDETCLSCHQEIGDHADPQRLVTGMGEFTGAEAFLWAVANTFHKPGPGACSDCHTEHEGGGRMAPVAQQFCSDCHGELDQNLTDTMLGNASDFGELHPQFQALVTPARGAEEVRISLPQVEADFNGLRFPHDMHLSASNGVGRMATRLDPGGGALECSDCHMPTADGVRFLPVDMETSCESCHSLVYDRVGSTFRSLSHGDIEQTQADLLARDRSPRRPVMTGRQRPGPYAQGGRYYSNFGSYGPRSLGRAALQPEGLCGECHYEADGGELAVVPVTQRQRYYLHGWFDHGPHEQEECSSCHAAETSDEATDLLLPDLESCRDCHLGEDARQAEVPSSCAMCHSYHPPANLNAAPRQIVRRDE